MPEASFPGVSEDFTHMLVFEPVARSGQRTSGEGNRVLRTRCRFSSGHPPYPHASRTGEHRFSTSGSTCPTYVPSLARSPVSGCSHTHTNPRTHIHIRTHTCLQYLTRRDRKSREGHQPRALCTSSGVLRRLGRAPVTPPLLSGKCLLGDDVFLHVFVKFTLRESNPRLIGPPLPSSPSHAIQPAKRE